ncbi:hypothetical protein WJX73_000146 [Symbiochloris irregularis]|uniref:PDZ domain-containing protein n=1 Tax=Symbiochloris irregularis TaxID=706552 RepID=A0AAW1NU36_9CHLO
MMLSAGKIRCQGAVHASVQRAVVAPRLPARGFKSQVSRSRGALTVRAAAGATADDVVELVLPAEEVLATLKINKRGDGMFIIEDVVEGSSAAEQDVKKGSVLTAVSDPAAPENFWELEARSSLRHVLDQMRMQQSTNVKLAIRPPSASEEAMAGREGLNRDGPIMDERTVARRSQQRQEFLGKEKANDPKKWAAVGVAVFLLPAALLLFLAISTGFLDQTNASWRSSF